MRLILVRHAVTAETGNRLSGRNPGIALGPRGATAASDLAGNLASLELDAVYCSPIQRCHETATILAAPHGRRPRTRAGLIEVDYGEWTGRTLRSLYRLRAWKALMKDPESFRFPNGETLDEVRRRSVGLVAKLAAVHGDKTVLAVSHGDVIRSIVAHCVSESVDVIHRLHIDPLGVTVVEAANGHAPRVVVVNAPRL